VHLGTDGDMEVVGDLREENGEWVCEYQFQGAQCIAKAKSRDDAAMNAARHVMNHRPDTRELTAEEEQACAWLAECGKPVESAEQYLRYAISARGHSRHEGLYRSNVCSRNRRGGFSFHGAGREMTIHSPIATSLIFSLASQNIKD